jgi:hypothetical protein
VQGDIQLARGKKGKWIGQRIILLMGVSACFAHALHARTTRIHYYFHACVTHVNKSVQESQRASKALLLTIVPGDCPTPGEVEIAPHWSASSVDSGASGLVGEKVALSVLIDEAGERGLHCISSLVEASLLRFSSDSTAVLVR